MLGKNKSGNNSFGTIRKIMSGLLLALILGLLVPTAQPQPVYAQKVETGYLWSLTFDFDNSYNGRLTIEVGPWEDGELVEVVETSGATVKCAPVGAVALVGGSAVFNGGHLQCEMDLAAVVLRNHGLTIDEVDNYGSIVMRARINTAATTVAPIFTHPDAEYVIDFTQTSSVTLNQELWNNAGVSQATFLPMVTLNMWRTFTYQYICIFGGGPCNANFGVDTELQSIPTAGDRTQFSTGPTNFQIGGAPFAGQIDALIVDPGNSAH